MIATTTERPALGAYEGAELWCPVDVGTKLRLILSRRDESFNGLVFQAIRLVRAMACAAPRGLVGFLYLNRHLPALRPRLFRASFDHALSSGRAAGVVEMSPDGSGVSFLEPEMATANGRNFDLAFAQMPLIAAFIDVAYLGLQPVRFEELCAPIAGTGPQATADEVAHRLKKEMLAWLKPLLEKEHYARQAHAIQDFCEAQNVSDPEQIDNSFIVEFWKAHSLTAKVDGFRKFTNAAHKTVAYRRAWSDGRQAHNLRNARSIVSGFQESAEGGIDLDREDIPAPTATEWTSPLTILFTQPCAKAAWVTKVDRDLLAHLVADPKFEDGELIELKTARSLFANAPPDRRLYRSVLRFTFFGSLQEAMIKRGREGAFADFRSVVSCLTTVEKNLVRTLGYVTKLLAERSSPASTRAVIYQFPETGENLQKRLRIDGLDEEMDPEDIRELARTFDIRNMTLADGKTVADKLKAHAIKRQGLLPADLADPDAEDMFEIGLDAMMTLHRHLSQYLEWLARQDLEQCFEEDMAMFMPWLEELYIKRRGPGAMQPPGSGSIDEHP